MTSAPNARTADDARFQMTMAAAGAERRNRPRWLPALALAALLLALIAMLASIGRRASAAAELRAAREHRARIGALVAELEQLQETPTDPMAAQEGADIHDLLSKIENYATEAGLKEKPRIPNTREEDKSDEGEYRVYTYADVRDNSIEALLKWIQMVDERVPGMQISTLILKPDGQGWKANVSFRRWVRKGA